jgi:hypothetical protein
VDSHGDHGGDIAAGNRVILRRAEFPSHVLFEKDPCGDGLPRERNTETCSGGVTSLVTVAAIAVRTTRAAAGRCRARQGIV